MADTENDRLRAALKSIADIAAKGLAAPLPIPTEPKPTLPGLTGYTLAFREEYSGNLNQWTDREPWEVPPGYQMSAKTYAPLPAFGTTSDAVVALSNGMLAHRLRVRKTPAGDQMCGSTLNTRASMNNFVHGYIEGRFKVPVAAQSWPAFWLLGNNLGPSIYGDDKEGGWPETGEIDIFEFVNNGKDDGVPYTTVHWSGPPSGGNDGHYQKTFEWPQKLSRPTDFHTWGFKRTADELAVYIDSLEWSRITRPEIEAIGGDYDVLFNGPMHMRTTLSSAGGEEGNWAYDPNRPAAQGDMLIEYIRVWKAP
jgi:beta-glucanase (GH16 family)